MRNLDKLFKNRIINKNKLIEFGFKEEQNQYTYQEQIPNTNFLIKIFLSPHNKESIVIDTSFDEEFVLVDVNEPVGEYIAKVREYYDNLLKKIINSCTLVDAFTAKQSKLIIKYVKEKYNKELEFLWEDTPDCAIWRNDINDTWFGLLMVVKKSKFIDNSTGE
nr:hypothetical protein [Clostridia bacterium]